MQCFGENGLIKKAQQAKELNQNSVIAEGEKLNTLLEEYDNATAELVVYQDNTLPTTPKLSQGMTRVRYNETSGKWEKVTDASAKWYDYANKEWANVVLGDATFNSDGTLDESKTYSQLVWIPRFAYQITTYYHTATDGAGNINVVFIDENNQNKEKTKIYSTTYPSATAGATTGMSDYVVHPAFDYDGKHLAGFWMGKYKSSHTGCTTDKTTGQAIYTGNEIMTVKANVTSWRMISIGDAFTTCLNMNKSGNPYGLHSSDAVVDPHMVKNDEWGAAAYLSKSVYGKNTEEVWINNNSNYITGQAGDSVSATASTNTNAYNTTNGVKASTTGNIYGVYDMSGGSWEMAAAYVNNRHNNLTNGTSLVNAANRYKNVYTATATDGTDSQAGNYNLSTPANGHYGDAIYETSSDGNGIAHSWYKDYSYFAYSGVPFLGHSSDFSTTSDSGIFYFFSYDGKAYTNNGFRMTMSVL